MHWLFRKSAKNVLWIESWAEAYIEWGLLVGGYLGLSLAYLVLLVRVNTTNIQDKNVSISRLSVSYCQGCFCCSGQLSDRRGMPGKILFDTNWIKIVKINRFFSQLSIISNMTCLFAAQFIFSWNMFRDTFDHSKVSFSACSGVWSLKSEHYWRWRPLKNFHLVSSVFIAHAESNLQQHNMIWKKLRQDG